MSSTYSFHNASRVTVGKATKKSDIDKVAENTDELDERLEALLFLGAFAPLAGVETVAYDGSSRISTITYTGNPAAVVTIVYDDGNGGRIDYIEAVITDPVSKTIRLTYAYDGSNNITSVTRTVS